MRTKFLALVSLIVIIIVIGAIKNKETRLAELDKDEARESLAWHIRRAKVKGERQISLVAPVAEYATGINDLDTALTSLGAVIAAPVEQKSYINDEYSIITWYKLKIIERLTGKNLPVCAACGVVDTDLPRELLPLQNNEILISVYGGTVITDGVTVKMINTQIPDLLPSEKYLLFLNVEPNNRIGLLRMGPVGIFSIDDQGNMTPIRKEPHPFVRDVERRFNNSAERLRTELKKKTFVQ